MMQSNQEQLMHVFACLGFGVWLSFWYDLFRICRLWRRYSKGAVFVQDLLFVISGTVWFFLFALAVNGGELRPDILAAVTLGFLLCQQTAGRLVLAAARASKRLSVPIARVLTQISTTIGHFFAHFGKKIIFFSKKGLHRISYMLYNKNRK